MNGSALSDRFRITPTRSQKFVVHENTYSVKQSQYAQRIQRLGLQSPSGIGRDIITLSINRVEPT